MFSLASLKSKINHALGWAFIEGCGYKILYLILHIFLFKTLSSQLYTTQATYFAFLYMAVIIVNRGFDNSLLYHFNKYAFSQEGLRQLVKIFFRHTLLTIIYISSGIALCMYSATTLLSYTLPSYGFLITLASLLFIEIVKKNLKVFLYLSFYNSVITLTEIIGLGIYSYYVIHAFTHGTPSADYLFSLLLKINTCIVLFFLYCLYDYYRKTRIESSYTAVPYSYSIQINSYFLQLSKMLVSSQALIPLFTLSITSTKSASFFLIATLLQTGEFILSKLCYISGSTFFVYDIQEKQFLSKNVLSILLKKLIPFYLTIVIGVLFPLFSLLSLTPATLYFIGIYSMTLLVDNLLILYEKYAITYNKLFPYNLYSFFVCIIGWSIIKSCKTTHLFYAVLLFLLGKISLLLFLYYKEKVLIKHKG